MYKQHTILALIPARGGSKGIPGKNITPLGSKPLIAFTIESAIAADCFDDVVVSTDDRSIADIAILYGASVPFMRPPSLADDYAKTIDAEIHALRTLSSMGKKYDILVLLQPTSPFRQSKHILGCIDLLIHQQANGVVSVSPTQENPLLFRRIGKDGQLEPLLAEKSNVRRQDFQPYYKINGAIYVNWTKDIRKNLSQNDNAYGYVMESEFSLDIDEPQDLIVAREWLRDNPFP